MSPVASDRVGGRRRLEDGEWAGFGFGLHLAGAVTKGWSDEGEGDVIIMLRLDMGIFGLIMLQGEVSRTALWTGGGAVDLRDAWGGG